MERYLNILLPIAFDEAFTYKTSDAGISMGDVVLVEFRKSLVWGVVWEASEIKEESLKFDKKKIKEIKEKHEFLTLSHANINFINKLSAYNLARKGLVLRAFIGILNSDKVKKLKLDGFEQKVDFHKFKLKDLSARQQEISDEILSSDINVSLIDGVTGSGKTEIYFAVIAKILKENHEKNSDAQILILLPEIALTSQLLTRFEKQFGFAPCLWHSKIGKKEKREIFYKIADGSIKVLIGARSALLLPYKNLQLIIVDEEHDQSYKQEDVFNFNARDMAILKAKIENFKVILSSATPSIESYYNAKSGKYNYFLLSDKFNKKVNEIILVDLRVSKLDKNSFLSNELKIELKKNLEKNQQSLLFLNRRGYAPVSLCKACGQKINCPNCSSYLVHHKHLKIAVCHYCGHNEAFDNNCKSCKEENSIINVGVGVEKIKEEVEHLFPTARIAMVTSDTISNFKDAQKLVESIVSNEIDIIIGTQIIAKGYDFENLSLVGIVDADSGFYSSELRSMERSFQLLSQVTGRAGRKNHQGKILIQTYNTSNLIFEKIIQNDKDGFFEFELKNRKNLNLPPFSKMANFIVSAFEENQALGAAKKIVAAIPFNDAIEIYGPAPLAVSRLKNRYYYRIFLKVERKINLQKLMQDVVDNFNFPSQIRIKVDID